MPETDSALRRAWPLLGARLLTAAWGISLPLVLARVLVPEEYGTFKQAWLLSSTLFTLLPFGITNSLLYFVPQDGARARVYVSHVQAGSWAVGLASGAALWGFGPGIAGLFDNPLLASLMPLVAAITALRLAGQTWDVAYLSQGRVGRAALIRAGYETLYTVVVVGAALLTRSVEGILQGILLAAALRAAWSTLELGRRFGFAIDRALLVRQLRYALPFGLAFALIIPQQQFHLYAVSAHVTAAAFALYTVGCLQLPIIEVLYTPVSDVMMLAIAENDGRGRPEAAVAIFRDAVSRLSFVFLPLMALVFVVAPVLIEFFFTSVYSEATPLFRITLLSIPLAALPLEGVMRARAQNRFILGVSVAKFASTVAFVLSGLHLFGLIGALVGFMVSEEIGRGLLLWRTKRILRCSFAELLPLRDLGLRVCASAVAAAVAAVAVRLAVPQFFQLAIASTVFAIAYLATLHFAGGLPPAREWLPTRKRPPVTEPLRVAA